MRDFILEKLGPAETIDPEAREQGLKWLVTSGVANQIMETLAAGAFLTAFAVSLGANNFYIGLVAAVPHLANIGQLLGVYLVEKYRMRRIICFASGILSRPMLLIFALTALLADGRLGLTILLTALVVRYFFGSLIACSWNGWVRDFVPEDIRGAFMGKRLFYMTLIAIPVGLATAAFIDLWKAWNIGPDRTAYAVMFIGAFVAGSFGVFSLTHVPEPRMAVPDSDIKLFAALKRPFANENFRRLLAFMMAWHFAINLATPFFTVHMLKRLDLELTWVVGFITLSQIANVAVLRKFGAHSDRFTNKSVLAVCGPAYIACIFLWTFTTFPDRHFLTIPMLIVLHIAMGIATAGVNVATTNIAFKLAPENEATGFLAANSIMSALAAGIAPAIGGLFADFFENRKLSLIVEWESPVSHFQLQTLKFEHWDFFFMFASIIGLYALHRLSSVREEGEVEEKVLLNELLLDVRRTLRSLSNLPGLRSATEFPFELLRMGLGNGFRNHRRKTEPPPGPPQTDDLTD